MPTLRELTEVIRSRPGVRAALVLGADGLVIETHRDAGTGVEALAAHAPAVWTATRQLADAADGGEATLALLELERVYVVLLRLSEQATLMVVAAPEVALGELLFDLRRHRAPMAALV